MTHEEAIEKLYKRKWNSPPKGFGFEDVAGWFAYKRNIPLIHIPEVASIIGAKPSEIDPYFIGKDDIRIDWSKQ